jgi:hypothetical protein
LLKVTARKLKKLGVIGSTGTRLHDKPSSFTTRFSAKRAGCLKRGKQREKSPDEPGDRERKSAREIGVRERRAFPVGQYISGLSPVLSGIEIGNYYEASRVPVWITAGFDL